MGETDRRIAKILDALHDGRVRYEPKVAIYPMMDTLQLLIQKPLAFAIIRQSGADFDVTFSTCREPEYEQHFQSEIEALLRRLRDGLPLKELFIPLPKSADDGPCFYLFASQITPPATPSSYAAVHLLPIKGATFSRVHPEDAEVLGTLIKSLGKNENELSRHITSALEIASRSEARSFPPEDEGVRPTDFECDDDLRLPEQIQANYSVWMRNIVSKALSEVADSPILKQDGKDWLNLYCTIRRAVQEKRHDKFLYTAQYILSHDQREAISTYFDSDDIANNFEISFGKQCRIISDSVFYSGVSEFAYEGVNHEFSGRTSSKPEDAKGCARDDAEQKILGMQAAVQVSGKRRQRFIVPIHVGGIVWATLCTTSLIDPDEDWRRNYYLYRILLTQIAERLRVAAKDEYLGCLRKIFNFEMGLFENGEADIKTALRRINDRWRKLTAYFPYRRIELVEARLIAKLNGGEKEFVTLHDRSNPHECFRHGVGFDQFSEFDLVALKRDLNRLFESSLIVVEQHRLALRTAAAAIMGRNMSHNLGSHVLARYSARIGKEGGQPGDAKLLAGDGAGSTVGAVRHNSEEDGRLDRRSEFLTYLQRRMDFLAEVSTSDQSFWSETLGLREQLNRLHYKTQKRRFSGEPILLSYITGKESLSGLPVTASVEWGLPPDNPGSTESGDIRTQVDHLIACPGGEVGVHALYIILENIIRNSARHAPGELGGSVSIYVNVDDEAQEGLLKLDIIDPRSDVNAAMRDDAPLHAHINKSLDTPMLKKDNTPDPKNWGIREMQICAHYLRGLPFSELESLGRESLERSPSITQQYEFDDDHRGAKEDTPPVLRAYAHPLSDGRECLKYSIYLQRAKLMAAVLKGGDRPEGSSWKRYDPASLRQKGICLVQLPNWNEVKSADVAKQVAGYAFLMVESGISLSVHGTPARVSLPIRTIQGCSAEKIKNTVDNAVAEEGHGWMEPLHEEIAKYYRDKPDRPWKGKPIWGVAIYRNRLVPSPSLSGDPGALGCDRDGLHCKLLAVPGTAKVPGIAGCVEPLPPALENWHFGLRRTGLHEAEGTENEIIAAAWVDHATVVDFADGGAMLGHAAKKINSALDNPEAVWISVEPAWSDSPHTAYLRTCPSGFGWELLAAAVPRVAVLDERVQSEFDNPGRGLPFRLTWPAMGVWVPRKLNADKTVYCNLDTPDFDQCHAFLRKPAEKTEQCPIDILVLHLTVLEALNKKRKAQESLAETLEALIDGTEAKSAEIVLVTGRGVPAIEMDNVRYLPISALLESLVLRPSKLALMRTLWSASRPRNGKKE